MADIVGYKIENNKIILVNEKGKSVCAGFMLNDIIAGCKIENGKMVFVDKNGKDIGIKPININKIAKCKIEKNEVILLDKNGEEIDIVEPPNEEDAKSAKELDQEFKNKIIKYINKPNYKYSVYACRKVENLLLIECNCPAIDDGNIHIVYDTQKKEFIGFFCWYPSG